MAKRPDLLMSVGLVTRSVTMRTTEKTAALAVRTAARNFQFTELRSRVAIDRKMSDGRENVPTKVFNPLASVIEIIFSLPAIYLLIIDKINISHFWNITYIILITHPQSITAKHCISAGYKFSKARSSSSSVVLNISWVTGKKKLYTRLKFSDFLLLFSESHQDKSFISAQNGHEWK